MAIRIIRNYSGDVRVGRLRERPRPRLRDGWISMNPPQDSSLPLHGIPTSPSPPPWVHDRIGYYREYSTIQLVDLEYTSLDGTSVNIYQVLRVQLELMRKTLDLLPPSHLRWFNQHKPAGIIIADTAGRRGAARYTGGLNAGYDDPSTTFFDERNGIIITYGAISELLHLGICPTILHEIGHVMTEDGKLSYRPFPVDRRSVLQRTEVSRNHGPNEALCNAYMYFICYGSIFPNISAFGNRRGDPQRDSITRAALRNCPAFSSMLDEVWRVFFNEW